MFNVVLSCACVLGFDPARCSLNARHEVFPASRPAIAERVPASCQSSAEKRSSYQSPIGQSPLA